MIDPFAFGSRAGRVALSVRANTAASGVAALRSLEALLPELLEGAAAETGEELVVIRHLSLELWAQVPSAESLTAAELSRRLRPLLRARIRAALNEPEGVGEHVARFSTSAAALVAYLGALRDPSAPDWPFRVFRPWGDTWHALLLRAAKHDRSFAGDVLAGVATQLGPSAFQGQVTDAEAASILSAWLTAGGLQALPEELKLRVQHASAELPVGASAAHPVGQLQRLSLAFAHWPPLRSLDLAPSALSGVEAQAGPAAVPVLGSKAGGLVLWAALLNNTGLAQDLGAACPAPRVRGAVLWALCCCLSEPTLSEQDPLVRWWCGEGLGGRLAPAQVLLGADPEPVHRLAVRWLERLEPGAAELSVVPWGSGWVASSKAGPVVDFSLTGSAGPGGAALLEAALPAVVMRFRERAGREPASVEQLSEPTASLRELMGALDTPRVPDSWRPACLALASVAACLLTWHMNASVRQSHGWSAQCTEGQVYITPSHAKRVASGRWMPPAVSWEGRELACLTTPIVSP